MTILKEGTNHVLRCIIADLQILFSLIKYPKFGSRHFQDDQSFDCNTFKNRQKM